MNNIYIRVSHIDISIDDSGKAKPINSVPPSIKEPPPDCAEIYCFSPCESSTVYSVSEKTTESYTFSVPAETFPSKYLHNESGRKLAWLLASGSVSVYFYIPEKQSVTFSGGEERKRRLFEQAHHLFQLILSEACEKADVRQQGISEDHLTLLSFALFFTLTVSPATYAVSRIDGSDISSYVMAAKLFVNDNLSNATLHSASEYAGISPEYLSRLFKEQCGRKFSSYLREMRMLSAKKYFSLGEKSEYEVAAKAGYSNIRSFRQCFRERFGLTPLEFIKETEKNARTERV